MKPLKVFCRSCSREFEVHEIAWKEYYVELDDGVRHLHPIVDTDKIEDDND